MSRQDWNDEFANYVGPLWLVWKGHRDYEENVVLYTTEEGAKNYLKRQGVEMRPIAHYGGRPELCDAEYVPWGIQRLPVVDEEVSLAEEEGWLDPGADL